VKFQLTILGSSSAISIFHRHPTAQILNVRERLMLIDCGEGTQFQMSRYQIKAHRITHIFISHLHGDHYLGLAGLLFTMHLQGRKNELHLFGQEDLMDLIEMQLRLSNTQLKFNLIFHPVKHYLEEVILDDDDINVRTLIMNHRIPCMGYVFREKKRPRKLIAQKLKQHNIPFHVYHSIKEGKDFVDENGHRIPNAELTHSPMAARSYAYCSDTLYDEGIVDHIKDVDLLYHESTFSEALSERAAQTYHSTAKQAASIAIKSNVKQLVIGHFSARYKDLEPLLQEAKSVFPNTALAIEGKTFSI